MTSVGESAHSHIHVHMVYRTKGFEHCFRPRYLSQFQQPCVHSHQHDVQMQIIQCKKTLSGHVAISVTGPGSSQTKNPPPPQQKWINKIIIRTFACFF